MQNKTLFRFGFIFFIWLIACINECNAQIKLPVGNWGIRLGLNAVSITSYEVYKNDEILPSSSINKNGYLVTTFARFNKNRIFLQPELAWNEYNRTCSFSLPHEDSNSYYHPTDLNINSKAVNANFLVGYNIVHDNPFLFGIYAGSALIGTYRTDYSIGMEEPFINRVLSLNFTGILGFSINISKIYFDLRLETSLPNANLKLNGIPDFPERYQDVRIKKTESILSFSCGIML